MSSSVEYELSADIQYRFVIIPAEGYVLDKWIYEDDTFNEVDRYYTETIILIIYKMDMVFMLGL